MLDIQTEIGEIISVSGNTITVQLSDTMKSNMHVLDALLKEKGHKTSSLYKKQ